MTFVSTEFLLFFLVLGLVLQVVHRQAHSIRLLLFASFLFCGIGSFAALVLILITSSVDFLVGKALGATAVPAARKRLLWLSLGVNLGILAVFKYSRFLLENLEIALNGLGIAIHLPRYEFGLPLGISYFTFTGISYVLDVYYERIAPTRLVREYFLYVAYFPKLLAGPIVRAGDFLEQLRGWNRGSASDVEIGVAYFLVGAVKKLVIADQLGGHVDLIFEDPGSYDGFTLLQGALGYTVQIYCDFSGYSDMAVGCARMMGFRLPDNFAMPYSSVNITEFWRRWHITLSSWFRDYLFLPLEAATMRYRQRLVLASLSLLITMGLCGLWHGASWNFVVWGLFHGAALATHRAWRSWRRARNNQESFALRSSKTVLSRLLTLSVVIVGWVVFRAQSWTSALDYFNGLLTWQAGARFVSPFIVAALGVVIVVHLVLHKDRDWSIHVLGQRPFVRATAYATLVFLLTTLGAAEPIPFLYFQF